MYVQTHYGYKNSGKKNVVKKDCMVQEIFRSKEVWPKKKFWPRKIMAPKKLGPKCLVKIGPLTAEILLIWTNVARAYVACVNVTMTVGIF